MTESGIGTFENQDQEWMSPRFKEVFGYRDDEVPNTSAWWQEHIFPEDLPAVLDSFHSHVEHQKPYDQIVRYRHRNGSTVWIRCRGLAIRNENGDVIRMLGAHTDVTPLKKAEASKASVDEQLANTQEQLQMALEAANIGLWDWDMVTNEERLSDTWLKILGLKREDISSTLDDWLTRLHPEETERLQATLNEHITGKTERFIAEYRMRHANGSWVWMESNGQVIERSSDNTPLRMIGTMQDITERVTMQKKVEEERYRAEQALKIKTEFLATMSHEIRTPLNGIIGMTDIILSSNLEPTHREQLDIVQTCSENLLSIVNDVLDLSKIEAGKMELDCAAFDPRQLTDSVLGMFHSQLAHGSVELNGLVSAHVPYALYGDETRVRQIIINLISNALKFTDQGEVSLYA